MCNYVIWGTGEIFEKFLKEVQVIDPIFEKKILFYVDSDIGKRGSLIRGKEIHTPEYLYEYKGELKIIICTNYITEIKRLYRKKKGFENKTIVEYYSFLSKTLKDSLIKEIKDLGNKGDLFERNLVLLNDTIGNILKYDILDRYGEYIKYYSTGILLKDYNKLIYLYDIPERNYSNKNIVINGLFPYFPELALSYILSKNGAKVKYYFNDNSPMGQIIKKEKKNIDYINSLDIDTSPSNIIITCLTQFIDELYVKIFFKHENLEFINFSRILNFNITSQSMDITEKHALSYTKRFAETDEIDFKDEKIKNYYKRALLEATHSLHLGMYIHENINFDIFVTSHAIYSTWGPCFEYLVNEGHKCLVYGSHAYIDQSWLIEEGKALQFLNEGPTWQNMRGRILEAVQQQRVEQYMKKRFELAAVDTSEYFADINNNERATLLKSIVEFKQNKKLFIAFPNVIWDGAEEERNTAFSSLIDWLIYSIQLFENKSDAKLIIRCHPAEATLFSGVQSVRDLLEKELGDLSKYKNVMVLESKVNLVTYDLVNEIMDVGLVYSGFLAVELPYLGIPVISSAKGVCSENGISEIVESKEEYASIIENYSSGTRFMIINREKILNFLHWYLYDMGYYFPLVENVLSDRKTNCELINLDILENVELRRTIDRFLEP
ncbi:hypothetical protein ACQKII_02085 [Lysinibacillus sp. NPDC048646]|uniref:hypothetical protein n=1 Tax=Lysinibacillus sp. NPDC048646 TaxID=3390574 RepID=UPI003D08A40A